MDFRISDTFSDSLDRLTGEEQKAVKTTAFDLQMNPAIPALQLHKLDRAKDKNFWSVRVNSDLRLIVHKTQASLLLCYVAHHDKAYDWAERRKLEAHPTTGAAQLVEIRELVREVVVPQYVAAQPSRASAPALFAHISDDVLLGYGVPIDWLQDVRNASENSILELVEHLPGEAAEALLDLATGKKPRAPQPVVAGVDPFAHPDAQRRFRIMSNVEELQRALDYPWEKWTIFLHPDQRQLVERDFNGPARVAGSAGTGKTIVALHRAVHLTRANPNARVLLTTFSNTLANALQHKLSGGRPNSLFFAGDLGQRIFQQAFSWKSLGVDIRGRARTLQINYRTSHQIRMMADQLLAPEVSDVDGNVEERRGTVSVFNGPRPSVRVLDTPEDEEETVGQWLSDLIKEHVRPHEIGIFVRDSAQLDRARHAVQHAGLSYKLLDDHVEPTSGHVSIGTMHLAKGLEFRAVAVMACDDEVIPSQTRMQAITDNADLAEIYDTERHLLYVACTRARDHLLVTSGDTPSEFMGDLVPETASISLAT